jgi:hypothetical protein
MNTTIIPIQLKSTQSSKIEITPDQIAELSFARMDVKDSGNDLHITEPDLEEFVRKNVDIVFPQETLLIVGQQVINREGGRSDLVAIDDSGSGNVSTLLRHLCAGFSVAPPHSQQPL